MIIDCLIVHHKIMEFKQFIILITLYFLINFQLTEMFCLIFCLIDRRRCHRGASSTCLFIIHN